MPHIHTTPNLLLASLPTAEQRFLHGHLESVELKPRTILLDVGAPISRAYFPAGSMISLVVSLASGPVVEAAMVGRDSLLGGSAAFGVGFSLNKAIVQVAGTAFAIDAAHLRQLADQSAAFRAVLFRHEQYVTAQAQQASACNATHNIESRLARWLLRVRDLTDRAEFGLTQEFLAEMLGVRRAGVSIAAGALQRAGLIRYKRGRLEILDLQGLLGQSCECYADVNAQRDRLLNSL